MNILIIGAAGFLGRAIAHYFKQKGNILYGVDLVPPENAPLHELNGYASLQLPDERFVDLLDEWKPDACLHCGGLASVPRSYERPEQDYLHGPALTFYLLNNIREYISDCRFVHLSSAAVYGNPKSLPVQEDCPIEPISVYGFHKWQSEILCREFAAIYGLKTANTRIFSAYGIGLRRQVIWDILYKALTQPEILLQGSGAESRDFVHSLDIAHAIEIILASAPMQGESYNVASGFETRVNDLVEMISSILNRQLIVRYSGDLPVGTPLHWRADIGRIAALGFTPQISLRSGLEGIAEWCAKELR